jgi:DNA (cytosine-5)-methyltransferase 1
MTENNFIPFPVPGKKYKIIYADPAWKFGSKGARSGRFGELDYSCMSTEDICKIPVQEIADKNSVLFMWTTGAHMVQGDAERVIRAWGFKPIRPEAVWEKSTVNGNKHASCGPWGMNEAEYLLMGVRGSMCSQQISKRNLNTIVNESYTGKHSEKPQIFRDRILYRFGDLPRIELFARTEIEGWDVWGDQAPGSVSENE